MPSASRRRPEAIYLSTARRPQRTRGTQLSGPRPDRVAAWAVALGLFLIVVASATSEGATGGAALPPSPATEAAPDATGGTASGLAARAMPVRKATWYGPGLYGRRTACGIKLRRSTLGVAHRRLPCGTVLTFYRAGRFLTLPVIDRGPFAPGVHFDLTAAAARQLGLESTGRLRVSL